MSWVAALASRAATSPALVIDAAMVLSRIRRFRFLPLILFAGVTLAGCGAGQGSTTSAGGGSTRSIVLLNVSYDPTRELYEEFNASFAEVWKQKTGQTVEINQSHGGSGKQTRAVIDGQEADVVTLALAYDIDAIAEKSGLIAADWQKRLPLNSSPYSSTIVFLVRKGNPKAIRDWDDLTRDGVEVITPNPKTGGGARWNYLAAYGYALKKELGDLGKLADPSFDSAAAQKKAKDFVQKIYQRVSVLDPSARAATATFVQREQGDVLITWENEAFLAIRELGGDQLEIVTPSISILAEPPVAVVDRNAEKHKTKEVATAYLEHLFSDEGQSLAAKHFYRPARPEVVSEALKKPFVEIELFTIDDVFGGWRKAQKEHFDDGGAFDAMLQTN